MLIIYKYRSWAADHHKECLTENELYFSSPKDMNDPFDMKIPYDMSMLDTDEKIHLFIDKSIAEIGGGISVEDLKKYRQEAFLNIKNHPDKVQQFYESREFHRNDKHFGVLSFTARWDSILMWSHYSACHTGFALGFDAQEFVRSNRGAFGPVTYDVFKSIDPLEADNLKIAMLKSHNKAPCWEYEKEIRMTIVAPPPKAFTREDRIFKYPAHFLKEIILGMSISEDHKRQIIGIAVARNLPIYQMEKMPLSFEIKRRLLTPYDLDPYLK